MFIFEKANYGEGEVCVLDGVLDGVAREQIDQSFSDHDKLVRILNEKDVRLYDKYDENEPETVFEILLYRTFNGNVLIETLLDSYVRDGFNETKIALVKGFKAAHF